MTDEQKSILIANYLKEVGQAIDIIMGARKQEAIALANGEPFDPPASLQKGLDQFDYIFTILKDNDDFINTILAENTLKNSEHLENVKKQVEVYTEQIVEANKILPEELKVDVSETINNKVKPA